MSASFRETFSTSQLGHLKTHLLSMELLALLTVFSEMTVVRAVSAHFHHKKAIPATVTLCSDVFINFPLLSAAT
jgi:hypothetical protein